MRVVGEFRTPDSAGEILDSEVVVKELSDGSLEVTDPLFDESYCIGDQSVVLDKTAEDFMLAHWRYNALGMSTRQLTNTAEFTTKAETDRWSRMGHMLSVAVIVATNGGSPRQIMSAAVHDVAHRLASHRTDDLVGIRGKEDDHDGVRGSFMDRSGFRTFLVQYGITDTAGNFLAHDGLTLDDIFAHDENEKVEDFTNQPGVTRSLDAERLQYLGQEGAIWVYPAASIREAVRHAVRGNHTVHGEHIMFDDPEAAKLIGVVQTRCATEHWGDPLNDVIDELLMTLDRRLFTDTLHLSGMDGDDRRYYPGDVMYTTEEDWRDRYHTLAQTDAFTSAILKIAKRLADQQREAHGNLNGDDAYSGPMYPDWLTHISTLESSRAHTMQGIRRTHGNHLSVEMLPGKARKIDPWVIVKRGIWKRLSTVIPEYADYQSRQSQWLATGPYDVIIDFDHRNLGLSSQEKRAIGEGIKDINLRWPQALGRPAMPDDLFATRIAEAGRLTRQRASSKTSKITNTRQKTSVA